MNADDGLTAEFMQSLFLQGVVGLKEFRSWLEQNFSSFAKVRDPMLDAQIDNWARNRNQDSDDKHDEVSDSEPEE